MMITTVKITENGYLLNGNIGVPADSGNRHYQEIQAWIAEGNTPGPADPPPPIRTPQERFDDRISSDPDLKAIVDELESTTPGFTGRARARR